MKDVYFIMNREKKTRKKFELHHCAYYSLKYTKRFLEKNPKNRGKLHYFNIFVQYCNSD